MDTPNLGMGKMDLQLSSITNIHNEDNTPIDTIYILCHVAKCHFCFNDWHSVQNQNQIHLICCIITLSECMM